MSQRWARHVSWSSHSSLPSWAPSRDVRLVVILDDYHLTSDSEDVRLIMSRPLEHAPAGFQFLLALRGRPNLALGRLSARGMVAELTTEDLRFTRTEIEDLFGIALGQPLDRHSCDVVAERTQGWAASLQLVSASIAVSRSSEVGAFIEALDGASTPIYDFLAEEVLHRMSPSSQRVLLHAALIDDVAPELVAAALSVTDEPMEVGMVSAYLDEARGLGLLGARGETSTTSRIHPLLRQFLAHQLTQSLSPRPPPRHARGYRPRRGEERVARGIEALRVGRATHPSHASHWLGRW